MLIMVKELAKPNEEDANETETKASSTSDVVNTQLRTYWKTRQSFLFRYSTGTATELVFTGEVLEKYQALKLIKQVPPSKEDDSLFLDAVRGWSEKGIVYGLGLTSSDEDRVELHKK